MAASYPSSAKTFTTKNNNDTIQPAHVNDVQDEITAIEQGLLNGVAHDLSPSTNNTRDLGVTGTRWRHLFLSGNADIDGTLDVAGIVALGGNPRCVAYHNTTQSIDHATDTALNLNAEDADVGTMHDTATNNTRVAVPAGGGGLYYARGFVSFAANATGFRQAILRKNGTTALRNMFVIGSASAAGEIEVSWVGTLAAADYLELVAHQTSGGALNAGNAGRSQSSELVLVKLA